MKTAYRHLATLVLITSASITQSDAQMVVSRSVFGSGAAVVVGDRYRLVGGLGEPVVGRSTGANLFLSSGFLTFVESPVATGTDDAVDPELPTEFGLDQNYPNPFNPTTLIPFQVAEPTHVVLKVYDLLGREVATLIDDQVKPGRYQASFGGDRFGSGVYVYSIRMGDFRSARQMLLIK